MAQKTVFLCDGCGRERGSVNHWYETYETAQCWELMPFDETAAKHDPKIKVWCGQECVVKALSEYMERCRERVGT